MRALSLPHTAPKQLPDLIDDARNKYITKLRKYSKTHSDSQTLRKMFSLREQYYCESIDIFEGFYDDILKKNQLLIIKKPN